MKLEIDGGEKGGSCEAVALDLVSGDGCSVTTESVGDVWNASVLVLRKKTRVDQRIATPPVLAMKKSNVIRIQQSVKPSLRRT